MRGYEAGVALVEILVALLLVGIALVPLMQLYPNTLGFNLDAEYDLRLSAAATRKTEELIGLLRVPSTQIAFDATASAASSTGTSSASITIGGNATYIVILIGTRSTAAISSVTVGAASATRILWRNHATAARRTELWGLANPPTGVRTITVTMGDSEKHAWVAASFSGVLGASPLGGTGGNDGTSGAPTVSINPRMGSTLMVGGFLWDFGSGTITQVGSHTAIGTVATSGGGNPNNILTHLAQETTPGSTGVSMAWSVSGASRAWVALAAELRGAAVVASPNGSAPCPTDLTACLLVWTTTTQYSGGAQGVGVLSILTVVACEDANGNNACDTGERQARYDTKVTSRP